MGLHAKVPLIAFLGLMHLGSRCCSLFLVELGASMMVASTKVRLSHHDACFGQPAIDGLEQLAGQLMLLQQVAEICDGGAVRKRAIQG
jgi:hypothetical protein